jgi:hypothetical protein
LLYIKEGNIQEKNEEKHIIPLNNNGKEINNFSKIRFKGTLNLPFVTFFPDKKSNQKNQDSKEI